MNDSEPCCTTIPTDGNQCWDDTRDAAITTGPVPQAPPQLMDGMTTLLDLGTNPPGDIGRVYTYVNAATSTWTEHWVVNQAGWFGASNRDTRMKRPSPQPPALPWNQVAPNYVGWWHAAMTFTYQSPPSPAPQLPAGTFVFDVLNSTVPGPVRGRLFRTPVGGTTFEDRWILFSAYLPPQGATFTELHPKPGDAQQIFQSTLNAGGASAEYVHVQYTVAKL